MLTLESLKFRQGTFSLSASLELATGSTTAIIGPSGGGKSTLLNCIAGFGLPQSGRVIWKQSDITILPPGDRPISIIFQDNNLFPHMTAFENVAVGLQSSMRLSQTETACAITALDNVGLCNFSDHKPAALSGGQQSRVALARALARDRPLLLLDEPFAALGPALRTEMLDLVANLVQTTGATLLMVTHDPTDAQRIAAKTIFVNDGRVEQPINTASLLANPPKALTAYLGNT